MTKAPIGSLGTALLALALSLAVNGARAESKPARQSSANQGSASQSSASPIQILPGTSSKEPISIDADKLVYYDKERKAVYTGNVVVIQGDTKMTCSVMTVYLDRSPAQGGAEAKDAAGEAPTNSGVKRLEAAGPVTVVSKTQVATGDSAVYDKAENRVLLIGHVTLSDGQNVTKGDRLTYDLKTSQATIDTNAKSGRVHGQFIPSGGDQPKPK
jgi:lipopolysaccharide export system protein LptA